jgi:prepilin-type N-terminal cleavage/methylation domain-containing protein
VWEKPIGFKGYIFSSQSREKQGFTLIELLVVISIMSMLMAILVPVLGMVRRKARKVLCMRNHREIVNAVTMYAADNDGQYPESVATVGFEPFCNWSDPRKLTGNTTRAPGMYRSMSEYLRSYNPYADTFFCTSAPSKYKYLQESWDAGDEWDNPETNFMLDPVGGTYCFYFNYIGILGGHRGIFKGPQRVAGGPMESNLLVTDYFGYDCWQSPKSYGSCEEFNGASAVAETWLLSSYWFSLKSESVNLNTIEVLLHAGYTDGHVGSFKPLEVVPMRISITIDGSKPYPDGVGPGILYLPRNGLK